MRGQELVIVERERIMIGVARRESCRVIAGCLGRNHSVVSREIALNGGRESYSAVAAQNRADRTRTRQRTRKLETNQELHDAVAAGLALEWSSRQVSERLRRDYPEDMGMRISHEAIYETLFVQARGECRTQLRLALRSGRVRRVPRGGSRPRHARISGMVTISERPAEAEDRAVPGHWEGDLLLGKRPSAVVTLVERASRYLTLVALPDGYKAEQVRPALAAAVTQLPEQLRRSLTWDQGKEMAEHSRFTVDTGVQVYFCDPRSPWQRGSNENTNGLLRQYLSRGADLRRFDQAALDAIAAELNGRPRQTLGFQTPSQALAEALP